METHVQGKPILDADALKLMDSIKEIGIEVFWKKEWRNYAVIEKEIKACDALLAIVDATWQSSTWMMSEVTWANGQGGSGLGSNQQIKPIPIFLYPILERDKWGWLNNYEGPVVLDKDIEKAILTIKNNLFASSEKFTY